MDIGKVQKVVKVQPEPFALPDELDAPSESPVVMPEPVHVGA